MSLGSEDIEVTHSLDLRFNTPKVGSLSNLNPNPVLNGSSGQVVMACRLASPCSHRSAVDGSLTDLLVAVTRDALQEEMYLASMASLDLHLSAHDIGSRQSITQEPSIYTPINTIQIHFEMSFCSKK